MRHMWQTWCDWCHGDLELSKYEEVGSRLLCDKCNPNRKIEEVYVCIPKDEEK